MTTWVQTLRNYGYSHTHRKKRCAYHGSRCVISIIVITLKFLHSLISSGCGTEGKGGTKPGGGLLIFICIRGGGNVIGEEGITPGVVPRGGGGFWYSGLGGGG